MKYLPKKFYQLKLHLDSNKLGLNVNNMKYLGRGIEKLHNNLKNLQLFLSENNLGNNIENMNYLFSSVKSKFNL